MKEMLKNAKELAAVYRVTHGKGFRLRDVDPADTHGIKSEQKLNASHALQQSVDEISRLQEKLYAQDKWAILLV
ncbi:MAG TPA: polyphosphate kinase 2 family protein, partial [Polyangia bacterium]